MVAFRVSLTRQALVGEINMSLEKQLTKLIVDESEKLILRYHAYHNNLHQEHLRNQKRFGITTQKRIEQPNYWKEDQKFNPFYVRKKAKSIAKSIAKNIENKTYEPNPPYIKSIPKLSGGERQISIYQIPDAAVSKLFYYRLLAKNRHRFSSFSYAYRNDRNVHFAIQDIWVDISMNARTFIAEFDFSDFFGSISHSFLKQQYDQNGFFVSDEEIFIIDAFLKNRDKGIPQGTSISLFLANLVCWQLDKNLEREGLRFARYADDTVIWSLDYNNICKAFTVINNFSKIADIQINAKKSDGISLLSREGLPVELANAKTSLDFLGYSIAVDKVAIKNQSVKKIQKQISYLLYRNLIQPLKGSTLRSIMIPNRNKDEAFLTAIMQIRRYLYGGLTDQYLINYLNGRTARINFKGIMSFYPLVNDEDQLKKLDGWLLSTIHRSLKLRAKLLFQHGHHVGYFFPFIETRESLLLRCKRKKIHGKYLLRIPSFILIYKALQKGILSGGIEKTMNPDSNTYNY